MTDETTKIVIPKETVTRLLRDIRDVMTDPSLDDCGIIYQHSETDILTGYACIVGPPDSLYFGGYYYFMFKFPTNYPHSPPIVSYLTITNNIRFHPNFYANMRVCVSIINTWRGEQWSGCQNIRSILMAFQTLFDMEPLLHEPGIRSGHSDFKPYHIMVEYFNYKFACLTILTEFTDYIAMESTLVPVFREFMCRKFRDNKTRIREILMEREKMYPERKTISIGLYGGITKDIHYSLIRTHYDAIITSLSSE